ncbi:MAG: hypothetical protein ACR2NW_03655 [Thermodesulfobacteriota bacterium]
MKKILLLFISVYFVFNCYSFAKGSLIESYFKKSPVVIIGDTGFDLESTAFIKNIISENTANKGCLNVGLEITTDQQENLEKVLKGKGSFSDIKISQYVDRDAYFDLIEGISKLISVGKCIKVFAIDKPDSSPVDKDAWMAKQVIDLVGTEPVLVLAGNAQAIKKIKWINETNKTVFLAERLRKKGLRTTTLFQYWTPGECDKRLNKIILAQGPRAKFYIGDILSTIGAEIPDKASEVTDSIIVWRCEDYIDSIVDSKSRKDLPPDPVDITDSIEDTDLKIKDIQLKSLKNDIKNEKIKVKMSKDHVLLSKGKPDKAYKRVDIADNVEEWVYECEEDWGFSYECVIITFNGDQVVKVFDIE